MVLRNSSLTVGMPALIEAPELGPSLELAAELGLDFVEINSNLPIYQAANIDLHHARQLLAESKLFLTLHTEKFLPVSDLDARVRRLYGEMLLEEIALAQALEMPVINLHLINGVRYTLPNEKVYVYTVYREQYLAAISELRQVCAEAIGDSGLMLCIENLDGYIPVVQEGIEELLQAPCFGLTWDVGHDFCSNHADAGFWKKHAQRIRHMHLHDATGHRDHLSLGDGELDIAELAGFAAANRCSCVVEVKTSSSLRESIEYLRRM